MTMVMTMVTL